MDEGLVKLLENAGMRDKESRVYLALLEAGQATVGRIAQITKLKRPIIYVTLEGLRGKGYANKISNRTVNTYSAGDPSVIGAQLNTTAKQFSEMLPYMQTLERRSGKRPRVTFFDAPQAIWGIYKEQSHYADVSLITSYSRLYQHFPNETEEWLRNCENGVYLLRNWQHVITSEPKDVEIGKRLASTGQKVKSITSKETHVVDIAIYENKISITLIDKEPFINVIESAPLVRSMRGIFDIVWKTGKPVR